MRLRYCTHTYQLEQELFRTTAARLHVHAAVNQAPGAASATRHRRIDVAVACCPCVPSGSMGQGPHYQTRCAVHPLRVARRGPNRRLRAVAVAAILRRCRRLLVGSLEKKRDEMTSTPPCHGRRYPPPRPYCRLCVNVWLRQPPH